MAKAHKHGFVRRTIDYDIKGIGQGVRGTKKFVKKQLR
jgi:hypothetical protein